MAVIFGVFVHGASGVVGADEMDRASTGKAVGCVGTVVARNSDHLKISSAVLSGIAAVLAGIRPLLVRSRCCMRGVVFKAWFIYVPAETTVVFPSRCFSSLVGVYVLLVIQIKWVWPC